MAKPVYTIYRITNTANSLAYVGVTGNCPHKRFSRHLSGARWIEKRPRSLLQKAMKEIGAEKFTMEVVRTVGCWFAARLAERNAIRHYGTFYPSGYNNTRGGDGVPSFGEPSQEVRLRISKAITGRIFTPEHRAKLGFFRDKNLSQEHRAKISASHLGKKGPPVSAETRAKQSAFRKGRKLPSRSDAEREKMSEIKLAWAQTEAGLANARLVGELNTIRCLGTKHSPESIAKMAESRRLWHATASEGQKRERIRKRSETMRHRLSGGDAQLSLL
jgi:group I intron endonuclease